MQFQIESQAKVINQLLSSDERMGEDLDDVKLELSDQRDDIDNVVGETRLWLDKMKKDWERMAKSIELCEKQVKDMRDLVEVSAIQALQSKA